MNVELAAQAGIIQPFIKKTAAPVLAGLYKNQVACFKTIFNDLRTCGTSCPEDYKRIRTYHNPSYDLNIRTTNTNDNSAVCKQE